MVDIELLKRIYSRLDDDLSKEIFKNRLMYSITQDVKWVRENVKNVGGGEDFIEQLERCEKTGEMVIFGAGIWGRNLFLVTKSFPWKCFIDNKPKVAELEGLPVIAYKDFINKYNGEYILVSSRIYCDEMVQQLYDDGIQDDKIINAGKIINNLMVNQYFDLEFLQPAVGEEIFVDAGSLDGMTSIYFSKWSKKDSFVYAFEPGLDNAEKCRKNLEKHQIRHKVISKGLWSEETKLSFKIADNGSSKIIDSGDEVIEVISLDKELKDKKITFIKMDIEGSELQALYGAKETIIRNKPKLAICVYHRMEDIWKIPEIILQFNSGYRFYLRHYSLCGSETVLYAIP